MNASVIAIILLVFQFVVMGVGLSGKYIDKPLWSSWPDWVSAMLLLGQFVNVIIFTIK